MSRDDPQLKLRLPQDLKDMVEQAAKDHGRSINAELVYRIEQSFSHQPDEKDRVIEKQQQVIDDAIAKINEIFSTSKLFVDNKKAP